MNGQRIAHDSTDSVLAEEKIRPLRDGLVVKPLAWTPSSILEVVHDTKPLRGTVLAVGPGCYPRRYNQDRSKTWDSRAFRKTEVRVGDVVELGGLEQGGYLFPTLQWGDDRVVLCTEKDVCAIVE